MKTLSVFGVVALLVLSMPADTQAQNLFVADYVSGNIYEFTTNGVQSTFASGLAGPCGLASDRAGNLFVADYGSGNIYEFTTNGVKRTFVSGLAGPWGLAFDSVGNLFVTDISRITNDPYSFIYKITPSGGGSTLAFYPSRPLGGLASDGAGNLFAGIVWSESIHKFTPSVVESTFAWIYSPMGLAFDSAGNLFVADAYDNTIFELTTNGVQSTFASGLSSPMGLAFDSAGNLFEADYGTGNIYEFTTNGVQSTFASGLAGPCGLAFQGETPPVSPLTIILQPTTSQTVAIGSIVCLTILANGSPPLSYQWYFGTNAMFGATNTCLTLTNVQESQSGTYTVTVSNQYGSVTSNPAMLSVLPGLNINIVPGITIAGQVGLTYQLQYVNAFGPTNAWQLLATITVTNNPQWYFDISVIGQPSRFYRLVQTQ